MPLAFIDFEASSLGRRGVPIEVGWVLESGEGEGHLICPAPGWEDWSAEAEAVHGIRRERLLAEGEPHGAVARRLVEALAGCRVVASAPSWDGRWLSRLLRAAGLPRHALRLESTRTVNDEATEPLMRFLPPRDAPDYGERRDAALALRANLLFSACQDDAALGPPAHRALADARRELALWQDIRRRTEAVLASLRQRVPA
ncbi:transcriptional regulator [Roseomonas sp. NAR14]|uniref:Transcriptional regulator n=1 Tax=Roseomonas acroporae TaxID=2937791 RepID=A0A9X1Y9F6_9PROT|nr:transcriptional regulator [Roseomonas acroporae]MCK8785530.1 transcriptional regulator [Roseomonas acroporae]